MHAKEKFSKCQVSVGLAANEGEVQRLIQDIATHWSSLYLFLERFFSLKEAVVLFQLQALSGTDLAMLDNSDWIAIKAFVTILKPSHDVTLELSTEKHTSVSKVIPLTNMLAHYYTKLLTGPLIQAERELTQNVANQLKFRFQHCETVHTLAVATMLDPK
jgi:hypothetical protein